MLRQAIPRQPISRSNALLQKNGITVELQLSGQVCPVGGFAAAVEERVTHLSMQVRAESAAITSARTAAPRKELGHSNSYGSGRARTKFSPMTTRLNFLSHFQIRD
jgi:hypothetical protein